MDWGALPPEINSARMYAGAGAGPLMAAASAWNSLAAELATAASSYQSVIATLAGDEWLGPASASMVAAVTPYVGWMNSTAAAAEHAANQATASGAAYQTAFSMTVPPPVIAANRAQLAALVATNILGQNTPAIMATEAHYGEMWAQDAAAMYGYAGSSASAATLHPLLSPMPTTNPAGMVSQAAAVSQASATSTQTGLSQLLSNLTSTLQGLVSPLGSSSGSGGILGGLDSFLGIPFVENSINGAVNTTAWFTMNAVPNAVLAAHTLAGAAPAAAASDVSGAPVAGGLGAGLGGTVLAGTGGPAASAGAAGLGGAPVLAGVGQASTVGRLSVPASWSATTPESASEAMLTGTGWTAATEEPTPVTAMPAGMPSVASAGRGSFGFGAPRYGVKPTVMPKPVGVG